MLSRFSLTLFKAVVGLKSDFYVDDVLRLDNYIPSFYQTLAVNDFDRSLYCLRAEVNSVDGVLMVDNYLVVS